MAEITRADELASLLGPPATGEDRDLVVSVVNYCHPAGTCKLGPLTDPNAVVGPDGAVHGVDGLYVADASLMPSITRGNINLPTAALGARAACLLLGIEPGPALYENTLSALQRIGYTVPPHLPPAPPPPF